MIKGKIKTMCKIVSNHVFYLMHKRPKILSHKKTIDYIIKNHASLSRFGDGEFLWMINDHSFYFQNKNETLANKLAEVLTSKNPKILVSIPGSLQIIKRLKTTLHSRIFYYFWIGTKYRKIYPYLSHNYVYGDSYTTRFYIDYTNKRYRQINDKIHNLKKLWDKRNIIFVEGCYSMLGIGNDLFSNSLSIRRIICPNKNAFNYYDIILNSIIKHYSCDDLIILALGPTATVMSYELQSLYNIQSLDLGHIDNEYYWFINKCKKRTTIPYKHTAEKNNDDYLEALDNHSKKLYNSQIIDLIK